jgi:DNA polymerase-1
MDWDGWRLRDWDAPRLLALFRAWGFRTFAEQVRTASARVVGVGPAFQPDSQARKPDLPVSDNGLLTGKPLQQGELFPFGANVAEPDAPARESAAVASASVSATDKAVYHLVDTPAKFKEFYQQLRAQKRFAVDLETTSLDPIRCQIVGLAFSWQPGVAWYLPLRAPEGEAVLDPDPTLAKLAKLLENPQVAKVNQNIKYDLLALRGNGA